jgi:hypothetical protein
MASVTRRFSFTSSDDPDASPDIESVRNVVTSSGESGRAIIEVPVRQDTARLVVSVGPPGDRRAGEAVDGQVDISLLAPRGQQSEPMVRFGLHGSVIFAVQRPRPGRWRVMFRYARRSSFVVRVVTMSQNALDGLRQALPGLRCSGCKEGLQVIAALAIYIGGRIMGGTADQMLPAAALALMFGVSQRVVEHILRRVTDVSLDTLISEVCDLMGMCPAE